MRMQLPGRKHRTLDPHRPHPYRVASRSSALPPGRDFGIGQLAQIVGGRQVSELAATEGCAVPGCGKPADDPMHVPVDK